MSTYIIYVLALSQILEVINYAQNKRQQNRPKHTTNSVIKTDFASQIVEKQESIASHTSEITSITANIDTLKADLKAKSDTVGSDPIKKI